MTYSPATIQEQGDYTLTISPSAGSTYTGSLTIGFTVNDNLQSTGSGYYVNLPKTGAKEASLVAHNMAKVYDDGGSAGRYSYNANGTLLLTAPVGYVIRLSGTIDVADASDVLTVYDGSTPSATSLGSFNADGAVSVVSTGTQMLVRFASNNSGIANGLNLTATAVAAANQVTLTDDADIATTLSSYAGQVVDIAYSRAFTSGKASTVCLPFAYQTSMATGTFYTFTGISHEGSNYEATMTEYTGATLVANTPYLFMPSGTGDVNFSGAYEVPTTIAAGSTTSGDWTYLGTYTEQKWTEAPTGIYGFSAQAVAEDGISQGQFVKVGAYVEGEAPALLPEV